MLGLPLNTDALVLVTLCGDHDIGLVQHKHSDLFGVKDLQLEGPVEDGPRRSDHNLFLNHGAARHYMEQVAIATKSTKRLNNTFVHMTIEFTVN